MEKVLKDLGLEWTVSARELVDKNGNDTPYLGIFRDDTDVCLSARTSRYEITQNDELLKLLTTYFGNDILTDIRGGYYGNGERIWVSMKYDTGDLFKNSPQALEQRMIIGDSHDGSIRLSLGFQELVKICTNGVVRWLDKKDGFNFHYKHTPSIKEKLLQFDIMFKQFVEVQKNHNDLYKQWISTPVSRELAQMAVSRVNDVKYEDFGLKRDEFIKTYSAKKKNIMEQQLQAIEVEMNRQGKNKFGLFMGFTHYTSHMIGNTKTRKERTDELVYGGGYNINNRAYELIKVL